jgi:hypothetical protein
MQQSQQKTTSAIILIEKIVVLLHKLYILVDIPHTRKLGFGIEEERFEKEVYPALSIQRKTRDTLPHRAVEAVT